MKICYSPAVRNKISVKLPFISQKIVEIFASAAWLSVQTIISAHNSLCMSFSYKSLEGRQICLPKLFFRYLCIKAMSLRLRTAVYRKMLCTSRGFIWKLVALKSFYKCAAQPRSQIRILSVSFLTSSPSWIPENIYIRSPES